MLVHGGQAQGVAHAAHAPSLHTCEARKPGRNDGLGSHYVEGGGKEVSRRVGSCAVPLHAEKPADEKDFSTIRTFFKTDSAIMNLCGSVSVTP